MQTVSDDLEKTVRTSRSAVVDWQFVVASVTDFHDYLYIDTAPSCAPAKMEVGLRISRTPGNLALLANARKGDTVIVNGVFVYPASGDPYFVIGPMHALQTTISATNVRLVQKAE